MYKNKDEMPMFLTVMDVANLLGISRASSYQTAHPKEVGHHQQTERRKSVIERTDIRTAKELGKICQGID